GKYTERFAPVSSVLVSSKVGGDTTLEAFNSAAVWELHKKFKKIVNSNGDTVFGLTDLEEKVVKAADSFVFLPIPKQIKQLTKPVREELFREMFKASSLHVGAQTRDPNLHLGSGPDVMPDSEAPLKPIVMVNHKGCYDWFKELINH